MTVSLAREASARDHVGRGVWLVLLLGLTPHPARRCGEQVRQHKCVFVLYLVLYVVLMAGSLPAAAFLLRTDFRLAGSLVTPMTSPAVFGSFLSQTTGRPKRNADIRNEAEPLALASLSTEGVAVVLGAYKIALRHGLNGAV